VEQALSAEATENGKLLPESLVSVPLLGDAPRGALLIPGCPASL
jgi:hypothetical protein